jgi:hypothetical protein
MKKNKYFCPVCGFELVSPAWENDSPSDEICPSCGIQFGYNDMIDNLQTRKMIYVEWRKKWIEEGMKFWSTKNPFHPQPKDWDPEKQLENIPEDFK